MKPFVKMEVNPKLDDDEILRNEDYQVNVKFLEKGKGYAGWVWLSIKRTDKDAIHDWRELQKIKNEICGEDREGVELYPAEKRLVDTSNQFHIFVMPNGDVFPFGYGGRMIVKGHDDFVEGKGGSKQRPFDEEPEDAKTLEEVKKDVAEFLEGKQ